MSFPDDVLMAYVDGELDGETTAAVDAAVAQSPEFAARVERQRALRRTVCAAFEPVLQEPMPQRLLDTARGAAAMPVASRIAPGGTGAVRAVLSPRRWAWFEWGAMATSVALGVLVGGVFLGNSRHVPMVAETTADFVADRTGMLARGALARALSEQLASTQPPDAPVRVGLSFVSTAGEYCRTFALQEGGAAARLGGLACKRGGEWRLQVIAQDDRRGGVSGGYRMAGIEVPPPVLRAVEDRMRGSALDAEAERAAQQRAWER